MGHLEGNFTPVLYIGRKVPTGYTYHHVQYSEILRIVHTLYEFYKNLRIKTDYFCTKPLIFVTEMECVFWEVWTESVCIAQVKRRLQSVAEKCNISTQWQWFITHLPTSSTGMNQWLRNTSSPYYVDYNRVARLLYFFVLAKSSLNKGEDTRKTVCSVNWMSTWT